MREHFLLRPDVAFLNHGSFGACPRPVFERYQEWQRELEAEPVEFLGRRRPSLVRQAREALGSYVNANPLDLVFVSSATVGVNVVARSLRLERGDEVLTTDHEYGACDRIWRFTARNSGIDYRRVPIAVPVTTNEEFVESFMSHVSPRTKVIFISHMTSPTALTFPIEEICRRAREMGIVTVIDGAHIPGQVDLDITALDADFYIGNLHKWLCAPKGAGFLYARRELQETIDPLIVSWGWEADVMEDSPFVDALSYGGTDDISAWLTVPSAIDFQRENNWNAVRESCNQIVLRARPLIAEALDAIPLAPDRGEWFTQMSAFLLPEGYDGFALQRRLFDDHRVEIPVMPWNGRQTIRISVQAYNTWDDVERLLQGVGAVASR